MVFTSILAILAVSFPVFVSAYDPALLQDFCVAIEEHKDAVFVNGKFCKNPDKVKAKDFFFSGLNAAADTNNNLGSNVTNVNVNMLPGLNTMGVSIARIDYAPYGINPPHIHPRGTELIMCSQGTLYVGFVSSNGDGNRFFTKILYPGDLFVFPFATIHFQVNIAKTPAVTFSSFSSQDAGVTTVANALFGSDPKIDPGALARSFQLDINVVKRLQSKLWDGY